MKAPVVTAAEAEGTAIFRWGNRKALTKAFMDQNLKKYSRETFNIIGMQGNASSVFEGGDNAPAISSLAHGFGLGAFLCKPGEGPAMHQHIKEETFTVVDGQITLYWMNDSDKVEVVLNKLDTILVPSGLYRGFYNSGKEDAIVLSIFGGPEPDVITWHPTVTQEARDAGLNVTDDGKLVE